MRHVLFVTTAAAALLAGIGIASAQSDKGASAPPAGQSKSMEKPADNAAATKSETTGQSGAAKDQAQQDTQKRDSNTSTTGQSGGGAMKSQNGTSSPSSGTSAQSDKSPSSGSSSPNAGKSGSQQNAQSPGSSQTNSAQGQSNPGSSSASSAASGSSSSANNTTNVNVNITPEQKTRIRETVIKSGNAPRVANANFSVSIGAAIPTSVRLAPVPSTIVEINPAWRGFEYVVVGEEIIIVNPRTHKIVYILA